MVWYRVYFLSRHGDIRNVDEFAADDDQSALTLADGMHEAVSDLYEGYEVWQDSRCVRRCPHSQVRPFVAQHGNSERIKAEMLRRLNALQSSSTFARSSHLIERINELQETVGPPRKRRHLKAG